SRPQGARCDIGAFESAPVGGFEVDPADATVVAGDEFLLDFTWTHTTQWRELQTLELRIVRERQGDVALWVRWDQESNTFNLLDEHGRPGKPAEPGSHKTLKTRLAELLLEDTSVLTSGPAGKEVTLTLALRFTREAAGHRHRDYRIEVLATDDAGTEQGFDTAGTVRVLAP